MCENLLMEVDEIEGLSESLLSNGGMVEAEHENEIRTWVLKIHMQGRMTEMALPEQTVWWLQKVQMLVRERQGRTCIMTSGGTTKKRMVQALISPRKRTLARPTVKTGGTRKSGEDKGLVNPKKGPTNLTIRKNDAHKDWAEAHEKLEHFEEAVTVEFMSVERHVQATSSFSP